MPRAVLEAVPRGGAGAVPGALLRRHPPRAGRARLARRRAGRAQRDRHIQVTRRPRPLRTEILEGPIPKRFWKYHF